MIERCPNAADLGTIYRMPTAPVPTDAPTLAVPVAPWNLGALYKNEPGDAMFRFVRNVGPGPLVPRRGCFYAAADGFRKGAVAVAGTAGAVLAAGHTLTAIPPPAGAVTYCGFIQVYGMSAPPETVPPSLPAIVSTQWKACPFPLGCDITANCNYSSGVGVSAADGTYAPRGLGRVVAHVDANNQIYATLSGAGSPIPAALRLRYEIPL